MQRRSWWSLLRPRTLRRWRAQPPSLDPLGPSAVRAAGIYKLALAATLTTRCPVLCFVAGVAGGIVRAGKSPGSASSHWEGSELAIKLPRDGKPVAGVLCSALSKGLAERTGHSRVLLWRGIFHFAWQRRVQLSTKRFLKPGSV